jgi:hypothetical protein
MTPTGLRRFSRVITTKRDGRCSFCDQPTRTGVDYAAVNASGAWTSVCASCSQSLAAQAAGLVTSINAAADGHEVDEDAILMPTTENLLATLQGTAGEALAYDTILALLTARDMVREQVKPAPVALPCIPDLRTIAASATAKPRDRDFAASLVSQYDRKGSLSEKQVAAAMQMINRAGLGAQPIAALVPGLYTLDGAIWWVRTGRQSGNTYAMRLLSDPDAAGKPDWEYVRGGLAIVANGGLRDADGTVAARLGHAAHACVFCGTALTDDGDNRSVKVGYGPICANRYGLPWG